MYFGDFSCIIRNVMLNHKVSIPKELWRMKWKVDLKLPAGTCGPFKSQNKKQTNQSGKPEGEHNV